MTAHSMLVVLFAVFVSRAGAPAEAREQATDWGAALNTYTINPYENRLALLALRRRVTNEVPSIYVLALADAQLRAKQFDAARRRFGEALARGLDEPWATWAIVGRAWAELAEEDFGQAREDFDRASEADGKVGALGDFAVGFLDAADGRRGAAERFTRVIDNQSADGAMRRAGRLGLAYARYWSGDYRGAADDFNSLAREADAGTLRDDALYGAAWSRQHAGDGGARLALEDLAGRGYHPGRAPRALVNLEPQALLQATVMRYRKMPLRPPEEQLGTLLDGDGVVLARAALRWARSDVRRDGALVPPEPLAAWRALAAGETDRPAAAKASLTHLEPGTPADGGRTKAMTAAARRAASQTSSSMPVRLLLAVGVAVVAASWGVFRRTGRRTDLPRRR